MRLISWVACAVMISTGTVSLLAEEKPTGYLSLNEALAKALEKNPALIAQGYNTLASEALIGQADVLPNPELGLVLENFGGTGSTRVVDSLEATVEIAQTLERGGKRKRRVDLAKREYAAVNREKDVLQSDVLSATAVAYVETLVARERVTLVREPVRLAQETVDAAIQRVSAAVAPVFESSRAKVSLAVAQAELSRMESNEKTSRLTLASLLGESDESRIPSLSGKLTVPDVLPDQGVLLAKLADNPKIKWQHAVVEGKQAQVEVERSKALQDISLSGGIRFFNDSSEVALVAGVSIPIPVFDSNRGNIDSARQSVQAAKETVRSTEIEVKMAFASAWQDLSSAHATVMSLKRDALPAMEEAHVNIRKAYTEGQASLIEVLDAQNALLSVQRELLEAELSYAVALARIEGLAGTGFSELQKIIKE